MATSNIERMSHDDIRAQILAIEEIPEFECSLEDYALHDKLVMELRKRQGVTS